MSVGQRRVRPANDFLEDAEVDGLEILGVETTHARGVRAQTAEDLHMRAGAVGQIDGRRRRSDVGERLGRRGVVVMPSSGRSSL